MVNFELGKSFLNVVANFREHSVVLSFVLWQTFLAVEVSAYRVTVLDLNLGMIFAIELLWVENEVGCKLKTRGRILFPRLKLVETRAGIRIGIIFQLERCS